MVNRVDSSRASAPNGPVSSSSPSSSSQQQHPDYDAASSCNKKKRVGKACDNCRIKKTKCNGKKPCDKCLLDNRICTFSERRRDKEKHYPAGYLELLETRSQLLTRSLQKLVELSIEGHDMSRFFTDKYPVVEVNPATGGPTVSINKAIDALVTHEGLLSGVPVEWDEGTRIAAGFDQRDSEKAVSAIKAFAKHSSGKAGGLSGLSAPGQQLEQQQLEQQDSPKPKVKKEPRDTSFGKPGSPDAAAAAAAAAANASDEVGNDSGNENDSDNVNSKGAADGLKLEENDFSFSLPLNESNTLASLSPVSSNSDHSIPAFFQSSNAIAVAGQDAQLSINGPELANGDVFDLNANQRDFMITGDSTISGDNTAANTSSNSNNAGNDHSLALHSGTGTKILSAALNRNLSMGDFENYSPGASSDFNSNNNSNSLFSNVGYNRSSNSLSLRSNTMTHANSASSCLFFDDKKKPELRALTNASGVPASKVWGFQPDSYNNSSSNAGSKPFSPVDSSAPNSGFPGSFSTGLSANTNANANANANINDISSSIIFPRNFAAELSSPVGSPVLSSPALTAIPNDLSLAANGPNSSSHSSSAGNATKLTRKTSDGHISKPSHHYHPHAHAHSHSHGLGHGHGHGHNASKLANSYLNLASATPAATTKRSSTFPIGAASSGSNVGTPEDTSLDLFQSSNDGLANSGTNGFVDASINGDSNGKDKDAESSFKRLSADLSSFGIGNGNATFNDKTDSSDFFLRNGAAGVGSAGGVVDELIGFPDF